MSKSSGDTIPIILGLRFSDTGLYPRARVMGSNGTEAAGSPIALIEVGGNFKGVYKGLWTIPSAGVFTVVITVYTDSNFQTESPSFALEVFEIETDEGARQGDAMTLTAGERDNIAASVRDVPLSGSSNDSFGQTLQILRGLAAKANMRIDSMIYTDSFLTSCRIRSFANSAAAAASTNGGSGEGEIFTLTLSGTPDIVQTQLPATILSLLS